MHLAAVLVPARRPKWLKMHDMHKIFIFYRQSAVSPRPRRAEKRPGGPERPDRDRDACGGATAGAKGSTRGT